MIKNYLKIAIRNLLRSKGFTALNIAGLATGMAGAILILLWIQNELNYDQFHKNKAELYQVWNRGIANNRLECWNSTPKILAPTLLLQFPGIAGAARTNYQWFVTAAAEKKVSSKGMFADPSFLRLFSFPLVAGDSKTALNNVNDLVITEKMAIKMFGTTAAVGKTMLVDEDNFTVTAVMKDLPSNTEFDFEYIMPWTYLSRLGGDDTNWGNNSVNTYVLLTPGASFAGMNAGIKNITKKYSDGEEREELFLYPISKWHLYGNFENGLPAGGRITIVVTFSIIAGFILLIACINFMNLSTARSEKRAKEVGIRKVVGAGRGSLIAQFLGESLLLSLLSAGLALLLVQLGLPLYQALAGKDLKVPYSSIYFWLAGVAFVLATGTLAGSYPAFFLSAFQPVKVLKGSFKKANALINPRKALVVVQFSFAIVLIVGTLVVTRQVRYAQARDTGYERGQLVYHFLTGSLAQQYPLVKKELLASGAAVAVTKTISPLTEIWNNTWSVAWPGKSPGDKTIFDVYSEDEGLAKTAGLTVMDGRDMDLQTFPTDSTAVVLNEAAVQAMHLINPVGKTIQTAADEALPNDKKSSWHITGVVKNFVLRSPFERMFPVIIFGSKSSANVINIKMNSAHSTPQNMGVIEKIFKAYNPQFPFEYHFVDEEYARKFDDSRRTATLIGLFAALTIFISCLGLFGLAAYMAENRVKEIGVRKVLGASVGSIATLLSKDFLQLVLISLLIASPVAWYTMSRWLQDFPYRSNINGWVFAQAGLLIIVISAVTVSFQAIRAAMANPVKSLRAE